MDRIEREGTLDKLSELHTLHTIASRHTKEKDEESEVFDQEALENAADNLMQHLSVDQLDMLHHRFMTGIPGGLSHSFLKSLHTYDFFLQESYQMTYQKCQKMTNLTCLMKMNLTMLDHQTNKPPFKVKIHLKLQDQ